MGEETKRPDGEILQLIIGALDESNRAVSSLNARLYIQQEMRRAAEYRTERLIKALDIVCSTLRTEGLCNKADCGTDACSINPLREENAPACRAVSEQQANDEESAELNRELCALLDDFDTVRTARDAAEERVKKLTQALRLVCAEMRLLRDCDQSECGTRACSSPNCMAGPALKLLESLEREVPSGE